MKKPDADSISRVLHDNAERFFSGSAHVRAIQDVYFKSRYLSSLFEMATRFSLDLSKAKVLDVGCSKCDVLLALRELGVTNLTGINLFPYDSKWLKDDIHYEQLIGDSDEKVKYVICDVDAEPFPLKDSSYDVVLLINILEHLHDPQHILSECYRVLSPGGLLLVGTPNTANLRNRIFALFGRSVYYPLKEWFGNSQRISNGKFRRFIGHIREYTMEEMCSMIELSGFQILLRRYYTSYVPPGAVLHRLYAVMEKLYPKFAYNMLTISRKPVSRG